MRTCKPIIICILAWMCFLPINAQTVDEEAMYIYHTDGSYNIFFRNEVTEVSIVTIDGVVFQMVQTGDKKHYYPLSQIQSISFVYPQEDTYKPSILEKEDSLTFGKYVDLGLPSGTKWASFNMGATKPEEYGRYYAWGETEEKRNYTWDSYIHCDGTFDTCHDLGSDISGTEYDVAHVKWGGDWRMPTKEEFEELRYFCTKGEITLNGIYGYMYISKINGNSIFLPYAGYRWYGDLERAGESGGYWSSTLYPSNLYDAYYFNCHYCDFRHRYYGYSIRPVVSGVGHEVVDLGLPSGILWATCNVGATKPEESGGYYAWGETEEKETYTFENYIHCDGSYDKYYDIGLDISGTEYDVAHMKWGGEWRMPTVIDVEEIYNNCTYERTTINGVIGYQFTSKTNGNSIFLPDTRSKVDNEIEDNRIGYWSSTLSPWWGDSDSFTLLPPLIGSSFREWGLTVRPVLDLMLHKLVLSDDFIDVRGTLSQTVRIESGNRTYTVESSNPQVATATINGIWVIIQNIGKGEATITVTDTKTGQSANILVYADGWPMWEEWNSTGTATYTYVNFWKGDDPGLPFVYRQNLTSTNLYQFKLSNWGNGVDLLLEYDEETGHVTCPAQFTGYTHSTYGDVYLTDLANYDVMKGWNINEADYGTFDKEEGIFTIPLAYYVSAGTFGYDPEYIYIDGVARKDYSINLSYVDVLTDADNQVFVIGDLKLGSDATNVKAVVVSQRDNVEEVANALATGEMEGFNVEAGRIQVPIPKGIEGHCQLVVVVIVDGIAKEVSTANFSYYQEENWINLGKGMYTDNLLCTVFSAAPVTYEVEVMENKETPGLYRLVYPYGEIYPYNEEGDWDTSASYDIEIDATNPDGVVLYEQPTGADWGNGMISIQSVGAYYNVYGGYDLATLKDEGYLGTLKDGVITLPIIERELSDGKKGQYQGFLSMGGKTYYTGSAGEFKLILPGSPALNVAKKRIDKKPLHNGPKQFNGIPVERLAKQKLLKNPF